MFMYIVHEHIKYMKMLYIVQQVPTLPKLGIYGISPIMRCYSLLAFILIHICSCMFLLKAANGFFSAGVSE